MKTLIIDLDDVICDNRILYYANKFLGTNIKFEELPEGYDFSGYVKDEQQLKDLFHYFIIEHDCYDKATLKEGCYDALKDLQENYGYRIHICSACLAHDHEDESPEVYAHKYWFIRRALPFVHPRHLIFTNSKDVVYGDVMIDDRVSNLNGKFKTKLLFDCWYNRKYSDQELKKMGIIRVHNWQEIHDILTKKA